MCDFVGKSVKVLLNSDSGYICQSGAFIKMDDNFIVIKSDISKKIEYLSLFNVKSVEILKPVGVDDDEE